MKRNKQSGEVKAGGSTISQQLAKNLFLNESRSYIRKGEEAAITAMMEAVTDKDRIFELYLNSIEWHYGVFGAEAASQYFYKKPASALTRQQAAKLTARVPAPLFYADHPKSKRMHNKNPNINPYAAWARRNYPKAIWINQKGRLNISDGLCF